MFQNGEMPFNKKTADRLILIATNDNIRDGSRATRLPVHWAILYELTKLTLLWVFVHEGF